VVERIRELSSDGESVRHYPRWVVKVLAEFDCVWETMTVENRSRLVRTLVKHATFDATTGTITVTMADFATPVGSPGGGPSPTLESNRLEARR